MQCLGEVLKHNTVVFNIVTYLLLFTITLTFLLDTRTTGSWPQ